MRGKVLVSLVALTTFVAGLWVPQFWCSRESDGWYRGELRTQQELARGVESWVRSGVSNEKFETGVDLFDAEWVFGTYVMAGLGFVQIAHQHPEVRTQYLDLARLCIERLLRANTKSFDISEWNEDPIDSLSGQSGHAAYLGYLNLLLSLDRLADPSSPYAGLNDTITEALSRRMRNSPNLLLETYPGEIYPVDNCAVAGSIGLYDRATGKSHKELLVDWRNAYRKTYLDKSSGLLYQSLTSANPIGRGSGTALAAYFLSFSEPTLSRQLYDSAKRHLFDSLFGFGAVREYKRNQERQPDIDSGPLVFGYGPSATAFFLSGSRIHGDQDAFSKIYASAYLLGAPHKKKGELHFVSGGPLADAILLAMLTAGVDAR